MIKTLVLRDHSSLSDQAVPFKKICRWQVVFFQNCRLLNSLTDLPFRNGIYKEPISRQISVPLALPFSAAAAPLLSSSAVAASSLSHGHRASRRRRIDRSTTSPAA